MKKSNELKLEKVLITPQLAEIYLRSNSMNRAVDNVIVNKYANEIISGRWSAETGETLTFTKSGVLANGQHRLLAVIKSNTPTFFHIITGVSEDAIHVIDTGKTRSSIASFKIKGIKNDTYIPAIINTHLCLTTNGIGINRNNKTLSTLNLLDIYNLRPEFWQVITNKSISWSRSFSRILSVQMIAGFYAMFYEIDQEDAFKFMAQLTTGIGITNTTINILRDKLTVDKLSVTNKMNYATKINLIIKCWNYFRKNEVRKILKYDLINEAPLIAA